MLVLGCVEAVHAHRLAIIIVEPCRGFAADRADLLRFAFWRVILGWRYGCMGGWCLCVALRWFWGFLEVKEVESRKWW